MTMTMTMTMTKIHSPMGSSPPGATAQEKNSENIQRRAQMNENEKENDKQPNQEH